RRIEHPAHGLGVAGVPDHQPAEARVARKLGDVLALPAAQIVERRDAAAPRQQLAHHVPADEAGAARHQDVLDAAIDSLLLLVHAVSSSRSRVTSAVRPTAGSPNIARTAAGPTHSSASSALRSGTKPS